MLAVLYLALSFAAGLAIVQRIFPQAPPMVRLAGGFLVSVVASGWIVFLVAFGLSWATGNALLIGMLVGIAVFAVVIATLRRHFRLSELRLSGAEALLLAGFLAFSFWLMNARLSGDPLTVARNPWGDTSFHIAILRSFSWGNNYPPQFPFFGSDGMRYHFGADFYAAIMEKGGLPVDYALNLPGALAFTSMMVILFELARFLFRYAVVGLLAVVLLVTNQSLAFKNYLKLYDWNIGQSLSHLWDHGSDLNGYINLGPYTPGEKVSMFWTPNIWATQTQLILGMAAVLFVTYGLVRPLREGRTLRTHEAVALGALAGMMFWINGVLFVPAMLFWVALFFVFGRHLRALPWMLPPFAVLMLLGYKLDHAFYAAALLFCLAALTLFGRLRESLPFLAVASAIAIPQMVWLNGGLNGGAVHEHVGYLVNNFRFDKPHSYWDFLDYWWLNLGLFLPLMVLGAVLAPKEDRKLFLAIMSVFVFGNFVALGRDLGGHNHKVFNLWEILMTVFVAFAFGRAFIFVRDDLKIGRLRATRRHMQIALAPMAAAVFFLLVLSGIVDFMTLKNDPRFEVFGDRTAPIDWIRDNTPQKALFLTTNGAVYDTPTLAGRMVFFGGFEPWSGDKGHDVNPRLATIAKIYGAANKAEACQLLTANGIDYVQLGPSERGKKEIPVNEALFSGEFETAYTHTLGDGQISYYDVETSCPGSAAVAGG